MMRMLTCLAVLALIFGAGCGSDDKGGGTAGCGDGGGTTMKDAGDAAKDVVDTAGGAVTDATDEAAGAQVTYKCGCGKETTVAATADPPS